MKAKMKTAPKLVIALALIGGIAFGANTALEKYGPKTKVTQAEQVEETKSAAEAVEVAQPMAKPVDAPATAVKVEAERTLDASEDRGMKFLLNQGK